MPTTADQRIGALLQGRYRLIAELGAGASAHVYLADDTRLRRPVALKILHPGLADDPTFRRRLVAEAHAAATLNHPNIVHVYDWGDEPEGLYLVLEYLEGGSLRGVLDARRTITVAQAASIGGAVADALAFAHQRGVVHRDVKPANLMFDGLGSVHLADFGLARALADASWTEPAGVVVGTARYASPEQALGERLDGRSDVYSLALVLFEAVTGRLPFVGDTAYATLIARIGCELPPAPELGLLGPCLEAATHPDRNRRLDAAEFAAGLRRVVGVLPTSETVVLDQTVVAPGGRGLAGEETTMIGLAGASDAGESQDDLTVLGSAWRDGVPSVRPSSRPRRRRQRRARWAIAAVVALLLAAAAVLGVARFVVFNHVVPAVVDRQLAAAQRVATGDGLRLVVGKRVHSSSLAAGTIVSQSPAAGRRERSGATVSVVVSEGPAMTAVPHLVGQLKSQALRAAAQANLVPVVSSTYSETVAAGRVIATSPSQGKARSGSKIAVSVSLGPRPRTIPQFPSASFDAASSQLTALRLVPVERLSYSNSVPAGIVIATKPPEGTTGVAVGSRIEVTVSKGPRLIAVPSVANEPIAQAVAALRQVGLNVNEQIGPPFATKATTTNPGPGAEVAVGTAVTLYVA